MVKLEVIMSAGTRRRCTEDFKRETGQLVRQAIHRRPSRVPASQWSLGGEWAVAGAGTLRDASRL